jgi:hypothetical protein
VIIVEINLLALDLKRFFLDLHYEIAKKCLDELLVELFFVAALCKRLKTGD